MFGVKFLLEVKLLIEKITIRVLFFPFWLLMTSDVQSESRSRSPRRGEGSVVWQPGIRLLRVGGGVHKEHFPIPVGMVVKGGRRPSCVVYVTKER